MESVDLIVESVEGQRLRAKSFHNDVGVWFLQGIDSWNSWLDEKMRGNN